jgi:hypothetical protein
MGYGMSVIYIFTTGVHSTILGALLTLSPNLWTPGMQIQPAPGA